MPAILTEKSRIQRCEEFYNKVNTALYLGVGRTQTEWDEPDNPPIPDAGITELEELGFIKKITADEVKFVKPDPNGEIEFRNTKWTEILPSEIYTEGGRYLLFTVRLEYDDVPLLTYRQVGILEEPKDLNGDVCTNDIYLPDELSSQGFLHYVDNRTAITRDSSQYEEINIILEF